MPPRRRVCGTASPSPAPQRKGTPAQAVLARIPVPAKYSTSYGSPIAQLPDRFTVGGGGNITKAAAQIFTALQRDNVAAEARRRAKTARSARAGTRDATATPQPPAVQPQVQPDVPEPGEQDDGQAVGGDDENASPPTQGAATQPPKKSTRKRSRDTDEDDAPAEQERKERDARLRRERSEEARKRRAQASADAEAVAAEKAKQDDRAQQAAPDERGERGEGSSSPARSFVYVHRGNR